jgi:hypothetical protein
VSETDRDIELVNAEGGLRAAMRQSSSAFPVDPKFMADAIMELRRLRSFVIDVAVGGDGSAAAARRVLDLRTSSN